MRKISNSDGGTALGVPAITHKLPGRKRASIRVEIGKQSHVLKLADNRLNRRQGGLCARRFGGAASCIFPDARLYSLSVEGALRLLTENDWGDISPLTGPGPRSETDRFMFDVRTSFQVSEW